MKLRRGLPLALCSIHFFLVQNVEASPEGQKNVLVLPFKDFRIEPNDIFYVEEPPKVSVYDLTKDMEAALKGEAEIKVIKPTDCLQELGSVTARGFLDLGRELYRNLRIEDAIRALEKGVAASKSEFLDLIDPYKVAEIYLLLGLSYLEAEQPGKAHIAFKHLFAVAPRDFFTGERFRKGYLPQTAERALKNAAVDFLQTAVLDVPLGSLERTLDLMAMAKAEALVYSYIRSGENGLPELGVFVLERTDKGLEQATSFRGQIRALEEGKEAISRALSRWIACTTLPSRLERKALLPRIYLDTSGTYALFLRHPTRKVFHNAGFGAGLSYQLLKDLDFFVRFGIFTSFPDKYNDLVSGFTAIRFHGGIGYTIGGQWGRFFVHTGLDLQYLTDFVSTTDPSCKLWPNNKDFCDVSHLERLPYRFLGGAGVTVGVDVLLAGSIYASFKVGSSTYFFPAGPTSPLNFPLFGEVGLGYTSY